jgi:hypothetical protein
MKGTAMPKPTLRVCDAATLDTEHLIQLALESVDRTYANLAQLVMLGCDMSTAENNALVVLIAKAQAANSQMLSTLRHPSGGNR